MFESDEEDYYRPIRIGNAFSNDYVAYESNADKDKTLSSEDYLDKLNHF